MRVLTPEEITALCHQHPGWEFTGRELTRVYRFADFLEAIAFVNRVAPLAEEAGHHPDIDIRYDRVRLGLVTHDAGGISTRDADLLLAIGNLER